jgi:hypothetical protein
MKKLGKLKLDLFSITCNFIAFIVDEIVTNVVICVRFSPSLFNSNIYNLKILKFSFLIGDNKTLIEI